MTINVLWVEIYIIRKVKHVDLVNTKLHQAETKFKTFMVKKLTRLCNCRDNGNYNSEVNIK